MCVAIAVVNQSADVNDITTSLKNIAAAHFIIVLAITGMCVAFKQERGSLS